MHEIDFKVHFAERYFDKNCCQYDINFVDLLLYNDNGQVILYIESKDHLTPNTEPWRQALAQIILTNKRQKAILNQVALIYKDPDDNDILELIDCSQNAVMFNNDINWKAERPSLPTKDAVDRINDRLTGNITQYKNNEIKELYNLLKKGSSTVIQITEKNFTVVYHQWKNEIHFSESIQDDQDLINLFLVDILNGTKYSQELANQDTFFYDTKQGLIHEGTNLNRYTINYTDGQPDGIIYKGKQQSIYYSLDSVDNYIAFWKKYKRPPEKHEFLKILEHSASLYSDKYRRDTGGEYTPSCFVEKQVEILSQFYDMNDYIVCDPCAGVGNLENQFGKDYKQYCYLSTLEQMDVDTCKIKGFENAIRFDYLADKTQPKWKYKGTELDINEICRRENRQLMIIMNPPYQNKKGFKYDLAIEFFIKCLELHPAVIIYYCKTEFFLRDTVSVYINSGYKIRSHIFSNARDTFMLSEWSISQVVFDRTEGETIQKNLIKADRYEFNNKENCLNYVKSYTYDNLRPDLIKEIEKVCKQMATGIILGQWTNQNYCMVLSNRKDHLNKSITTKNLMYCLLKKGICFNTHPKYFETHNYVYRGEIKDIPAELFSDAIMFSLFYIGCDFTNKGQKNYIMPFSAAELGCEKNQLNVLFPQDSPSDLFQPAKKQSSSPVEVKKLA